MANATSQPKDGATEKPSKPIAVNKQLPATTAPVPMRWTTDPASRLDAAEHAVMVMVIAPTAAKGWSICSRMAGQATPSMPSGKPMLIRDR